MAGNRERRWIVISTDGRHVTLGRHSDPSEAEIASAEKSLSSQGLSGWLAIVEGDYWAKRGKLSVLMVRALASPTLAFEKAVEAFEVSRRKTHQSV